MDLKITIVIFISHLHWLVTEGTCVTSIQEVALTGHAYHSSVTTDIQACYYSCRNDELCQSMNFYATNRVCEFNNRTGAVSPRNLVHEKDAFYFDNPFRVPLGTSKRVPAISCDEIKQSSSESKSGRYWVQFRGQKYPIIVHCDMKTDGRAVMRCYENKCSNGGTCIYRANGHYKCLCKVGFNGDHCDFPSHDVDGCKTYKNLTKADRNQNYSNISAGFPACDAYYLASGWYRFSGKAGNMMATKCVPKNHCNTHAPGWMPGSHPTVDEGTVTRKVCFHWSRECCYFHVRVRVKHCGVYYVYYFVRRGSCHLRYCGKWGQ